MHAASLISIQADPFLPSKVPGLADGEVHVLDGRTTWGARVKYKCKDNYSLREGDDERRCEEGGWSGRAPRCVYTRCPVAPVVDNADLKQVASGAVEPNTVGARLSYTCHEGYRASGSLSRECQLGGRWSGSEPKCTFVDCGDPPKLVDGRAQLLDGRTSFGAEAEYTCDEDFR